jgi:hypothetical protein
MNRTGNDEEDKNWRRTPELKKKTEVEEKYRIVEEEDRSRRRRPELKKEDRSWKKI